NPGHLVEAGLDLFSVYDIKDTTVIEPPDTFITNINQLQKPETTLSAFPNPFQNEVNLSVTNFPSQYGELEIADALGRVLYQTAFQGKNVRIRLDLSLPGGIYTAKLIDKHQVIQSVKLVPIE